MNDRKWGEISLGTRCVCSFECGAINVCVFRRAKVLRFSFYLIVETPIRTPEGAVVVSCNELR